MIDLQKSPRQFCDSIKIAFTKEFFVMGLMNGETGAPYALTPGHMKRLGQYIQHQIAEYEKQNGEIQTPDWSPNVKSPLQIIPPKE